MEAHDPVFEGCRNILYILLCVVLVVIKLVQLPVTINCNINMVLLQPVSVTSVYPLLPSQVVSICDPQRSTLYWFHVPGLQLDNEVSQSMDQPHGTVCHQHYGHRTCRRAPSSGHRRCTCSRPPGAVEMS